MPESAHPPPQATLARLPPEILFLITAELRRTGATRSVSALRACSKALYAVLATAPEARFAFHTVSITLNAAGLGFLAGLTAPAAAHVREVVVSRTLPGPRPPVGEVDAHEVEQLALLGLQTSGMPPLPDIAPGPGADAALPGLESPFARQLATALCALPALEGVTIGRGHLQRWANCPVTGYLSRKTCEPFGLKARPQVAKPQGHGVREKPQRHTADKDAMVRVQRFRGVLFALAHAHAAGVAVATLKLEFDWRRGGPLIDAAFSFTVAERQVVAPFLAQLKTLHVDLRREPEHGMENYAEFNDFIRLCTGLIELRLQCHTQAALRLVEAPLPLPRLEVLSLSGYDLTLDPGMLIKLLCQWGLRDVCLTRVGLHSDTSLPEEEHRFVYPKLWDTVLRAVAAHSSGATRRLDLDALTESYGPGTCDGGHGRRFSSVTFETGTRWDAAKITVTAGMPCIEFRCGGRKADIESEPDQDVFLRAAGVLCDPAFHWHEYFGQYRRDWEDGSPVGGIPPGEPWRQEYEDWELEYLV
ncbi:hypothetical protein Q8F55_008504 [Vanrija albida]|uniref:F-box domain-containing protein n=1 Tax=Vanrija albida TaxID=181172 RepID=A0ABR3PR22_9TREE